MENVILYSTNCARCKALELKLKKMNIKFTLNVDTTAEHIKNLGRNSAPILSVDGVLYDFEDAVKFLNESRE